MLIGSVIFRSDSSVSEYYGIRVTITPADSSGSSGNNDGIIETSSHEDYGNDNDYIVLGTWDFSD